MEQLDSCFDSRTSGFCAYCGDEPTTGDHVPAKVFLDSPYPENLPKVGACLRCNNGIALDEEYLACLIACVIAGSVQDGKIGREKIRRILNERPGLRERLRQACTASTSPTSAETVFSIEPARVRNVLVKLARGHAVFELNEPQLGEPDAVGYVPLHILDPRQLEDFEHPSELTVWPEVGSRALQRAVVVWAYGLTDWVEVQPGRYRYLAFTGNGVVVRIVLSEYLACEVVWSALHSDEWAPVS